MGMSATLSLEDAEADLYPLCYMDLKVGDLVLIKRTSGATQEAKVSQVRDGIKYCAPEVISFAVRFKEGGKEKWKPCSGNDLIGIV